MTKALVFGPGEGKRVEARGSLMMFKATAATTNGGISLMERELPAGATRISPPHVHTGLELFYILKGKIDFKLNSEEVSCGPGFFVQVPGGVGHTFWNSGDTPARLLIIHSPALDGYFEALSTLWSGAEPPSVEQERELMGRFGMEPASE